MSMTKAPVVIATIKHSNTLPVCGPAISTKHTSTCRLHFFPFAASDASPESVNNAHLPPFHFQLYSNISLAFWGRFLSIRQRRRVPIEEGKGLNWGVMPGESKSLKVVLMFPFEGSLVEMHRWMPFAVSFMTDAGGCSVVICPALNR